MRLIDAEWVQKDYMDMNNGKRLLLIDVAPTIDAVPVVRCRDCKWRNDQDRSFWTPCDELKVADNWFCADGERREDAGV